MRRLGRSMRARMGWFSKAGPVSMMLLFVALAVSADVEPGDSAMRTKLAQATQDESRLGNADRASESRSTNSSDYRVDTGDRVSVIVYQEPDLSVTGVRVKANGTISYPLLGDLYVSGLTSQEVHNLVKARLLDGYLKKPHVTVSIDSYRLYFIKGEVKRPGGYTFVDGLTVAKAVALAGGYSERASQSKISLVRESDPENPIEPVGPNTSIGPGDIITVGESFF